VFTKLWLLRLVSALMIAGSAAFAFRFAREILPSVPWAAPVTGLAVALEPMLAFVGGAVNNDGVLILLATAELYLLARALKRGLDLRLAVAIGIMLGVGIAAKPNMYALAPVAAMVVAWALWQAGRSGASRSALARVGVVALGAIGLVLALRYAFFARGEAIAGAFHQDPTSRPFSLNDFLSYTWQWYLPPLPFMEDRFAGAPPAYDVFFKGFWANFGHLDTKFAPWVYQLLFAASAAGASMIVVAGVRCRDSVREWLPPALLGLTAVVGFALMINLRSYLALIQQNVPFAQGRYLLPAVAVFGVAVAAAAMGFGRRWAPVAGVAFVAAIGAFNLFSLGLVLSRFYT
jgi:4-amino-4-deoxy-L-arabinose transferase-like glycosyltransferase